MKGEEILCTQKTSAKFQLTDYDKLTEFWYATNDHSDISMAAILWIFCTLRNWSFGFSKGYNGRFHTFQLQFNLTAENKSKSKPVRIKYQSQWQSSDNQIKNKRKYIGWCLMDWGIGTQELINNWHNNGANYWNCRVLGSGWKRKEQRLNIKRFMLT